MIDRGNEGLWGVRGLIEEINWYRMKPDVQKTSVIYLILLSRVFLSKCLDQKLDVRFSSNHQHWYPYTLLPREGLSFMGVSRKKSRLIFY